LIRKFYIWTFWLHESVPCDFSDQICCKCGLDKSGIGKEADSGEPVQCASSGCVPKKLRSGKFCTGRVSVFRVPFWHAYKEQFFKFNNYENIR
jgi:hypothetical protein